LALEGHRRRRLGAATGAGGYCVADPARILVVDDDPWIQRMVATVLGHRGHEVTCVDGAEQARAALSGGLPTLVIVAATLPDGRGEALVSALRRESRMIEGVPALLLAGTGEDGV